METVNYTQAEINDDQRANLEKLAAYLEQLPEDYVHFDMTAYYDGWTTGETFRFPAAYDVTSCGTVACAVGHGPVAGIPAQEGEMWSDYAMDRFTNADNALFVWCFASEWGQTDNTYKGAAARIRIALNHGVPSSYSEQCLGFVPLCYTVE